MSRRTCFLVGLVLAVFVFPLQAQPVKDMRIVPGVATNMGQVASDPVVLHSVPIDDYESEFKRLFPDGSGDLVSDSAFVAPPDKVLVVLTLGRGWVGDGLIFHPDLVLQQLNRFLLAPSNG